MKEAVELYPHKKGLLSRVTVVKLCDDTCPHMAPADARKVISFVQTLEAYITRMRYDDALEAITSEFNGAGMALVKT